MTSLFSVFLIQYDNRVINYSHEGHSFNKQLLSNYYVLGSSKGMSKLKPIHGFGLPPAFVWTVS